MKYLNKYYSFNEARQNPSEIVDKYYSDIDKNILAQLIKADPTTILANGKIKKIGTYVKFLVKIFRNKGLLIEDLERATDYLKIYIANRVKFPNIDIMKFNKLTDLGKLVRPYLDIESGALTPLINNLEPNSFKFLFENDEWRIYQPLTEQASATLGFGSEWCTSYGKYSLDKKNRTKTNRFSYYKDNLLVFVSQDTDKPVWQLHLRTKQFNDKHDYNKFGEFSQFLNENIELTPIVFTQLNNLGDTDNLSEIIDYQNSLPKIYKDKVIEAYKEVMPEESYHLLNIVEQDVDDSLRSTNLLKLMKADEKYVDDIEFSGDNKDEWIELKKNFYNRHIRNRYNLAGFLSYTTNFSSGEYYNESDGLEIENTLNEEEVFGKGLKEKLDTSGLGFIDCFEELRDYLDESEFKKIYNEFEESYNSAYGSQFQTCEKIIAYQVREVIKIDWSNTISVKFTDFLGAIKRLFIERNERWEFELKLEDIFEEIFDYNELPNCHEAFSDKTYKDFAFDDAEVVERVQSIIYDVVTEKADRLAEEEKENSKTDEDRQKEADEFENIKKETLEKFNKLAPELGFVNWHFENDEFEVTLNPNEVSDDNKSISSTVVRKLLTGEARESTGYISPENLEYQFKKHVLKIEENKRIKGYQSFRIESN